MREVQKDDDAGKVDLVSETLSCYRSGLFDDNYDKISRVAPQMEEGFIYRIFGHIGSSVSEKNIRNALSGFKESVDVIESSCINGER